MKKLITLLVLFASSFAIAQVPQGISYQAIALNASSNPVVNSAVGIRLTILDNAANGTAIYTETQTKTTNAQGLYSLIIGQGTPTSGSFSTINWGINSKFLKVEIDINGGTNYVNAGTTQLLSVPYALAADSLITSPGEGITLISPNGTPYQVSVNDNGELSLPTSNNSSNSPSQLYLYGSFNNWDASNALQFGYFFNNEFIGYKYFTAGTQLKFLAAQNESVVYGTNTNGTNGELALNGSAYTIPSNGFYRIIIGQYNAFEIKSINVELQFYSGTLYTMQYNSPNNLFFYSLTHTGEVRFVVDYVTYGDNLADGSLEINGAQIISNQPYQYQVTINFNGSGSYIRVPLP